MDVADLAEQLTAEADVEATLDTAAEALETVGLDVERDQERGAILAARGQPGVALSGHLDVVPTGEGWSHPTFGNTFEAGRLYGRGTSDMRGPVAAMIAALDQTSAPAAVVLTSDEETTMDTVRAYVDEDVLSEADLVVVGEPTELDVAVAGKGLVWARVSARGARGHASTPRGKAGRDPSAAERLVDALEGLDSTPLRIRHPRVGGATLAISGLDSDPTPFNVLAAQAEARVDVRFPPPKTSQDVERALRSSLQMPREGVEVSFEKREPAFLGEEATGERACELLAEAGVTSQLRGISYVSEAGHWQRVADTLVVGPGSIARAHAPDEYIDRDELEAGLAAYASLVEAWGSSTSTD